MTRRVNSLGKQEGLAIESLICLVAWACSGKTVDEAEVGFAGLKWSRIRDASLCLLEDGKVIIPYGIVRYLATLSAPVGALPAARAFLQNLVYLVKHVDAVVYDLEPWQLWEVFGAVFHAARINALQILGEISVRFSDICRGALGKGYDTIVSLRPVNVIKTSAEFSEDMQANIPEYGCENGLFDWVKEGWVVVNGAGGKGNDIFWCLPQTGKENKFVTCSDQRKLIAKSLGPRTVSSLVDKARIQPTVAPGPVVVGLFHILPDYNKGVDSLPPSSFLVSRPQSKAYHGVFALHPASSPFININHALQSSLQLLFDKNAVGSAQCLISARAEKTFADLQDLSLRFPNLVNLLKEEARLSF